MKNKPTNTGKLSEELREMGFGNQAIIVGTKRVELYDFVDSKLQKRDEEIWKIIDQYPIIQFPLRDGTTAKAVLVHSLKQAKVVTLKQK